MKQISNFNKKKKIKASGKLNFKNKRFHVQASGQVYSQLLTANKKIGQNYLFPVTTNKRKTMS